MTHTIGRRGGEGAEDWVVRDALLCFLFWEGEEIQGRKSEGKGKRGEAYEHETSGEGERLHEREVAVSEFIAERRVPSSTPLKRRVWGLPWLVPRLYLQTRTMPSTPPRVERGPG